MKNLEYKHTYVNTYTQKSSKMCRENTFSNS